MARLARVILPGYPHRITQRGDRCQDVFFCEEDYEYYLALLKDWCGSEGIEIWAYCLITHSSGSDLIGDWKRYLLEAQEYSTEFEQYKRTGRLL